MRFDVLATDKAVLQEFGRRAATMRVQSNISQAALAAEAAVSKTTVERLESGLPIRTDNLVRILRTLGLLDRLELLVPEPLADPLRYLETAGHGRRRASTPRAKREQMPWKWGDER